MLLIKILNKLKRKASCKEVIAIAHQGFVFMDQNMGTCLVVITKHRNCETAKLQCDSKNLRNTEISIR